MPTHAKTIMALNHRTTGQAVALLLESPGLKK
jgi:hypothetical protein